MENYITLGGEGESVIIEKKSEFIGYAAHVTTEEQAVGFINTVRKKHSDAKHNVYAYVLKENNISRYSDDGEPQGTAGIPVLDIIRKNGFCDAVIVVTRYFGGILLGTGGLVRAYSAAAKAAVDKARIVTYVPYNEIEFSVDYSLYQKIPGLLGKFNAITDKTEFLQNVNMKIAVECSLSDDFVKAFTEVCAGKAEFRIIGQRYDFSVTDL